MLRNSRSGYATFASVTSFAKQTRAIANVGTPWSLGDILKNETEAENTKDSISILFSFYHYFIYDNILSNDRDSLWIYWFHYSLFCRII
ncbi:hypothetical protein EHR05_18765 [Leptospira licerasiae]|nr:hypothetical protein EHR05_18765 [Leptospira licerasiae]